MDVKDGGRTVARFLQEIESGSVVINRDYQRSRDIWPSTAQSYFIESILLGFPIPKLALYPRTDVKSRKTIEEIVDGQQRTDTMQQFLRDEVRVPARSSLPCAGKKFSQSGEEYQQRFLTYILPIDLYIEASTADIREVFRRINSYQAPLNAEEKRHAAYQGDMKWFIHSLAASHSQTFLLLGTFRERSLVRMADVKLIAELIDAMLNGVRTTRPKTLDDLYRDYDDGFPQQKDIARRLDDAIPLVSRFAAVQNTELSKQHQLYALVLAVTHLLRPLDVLREHFELKRGTVGELQDRNLERLNAVLEEPEEFPKYREFIDASKEGTNVGEKRVRRFQWMCRALIGDLP